MNNLFFLKCHRIVTFQGNFFSGVGIFWGFAPYNEAITRKDGVLYEHFETND